MIPTPIKLFRSSIKCVRTDLTSYNSRLICASLKETTGRISVGGLVGEDVFGMNLKDFIRDEITDLTIESHHIISCHLLFIEKYRRIIFSQIMEELNRLQPGFMNRYSLRYAFCG